MTPEKVQNCFSTAPHNGLWQSGGIAIWTKLSFGKYQGKIIPQLMFADPGYFYWGIKEEIFRGSLATESTIVRTLAAKITIPKPDPENWLIEYVLSYEGKFERLDIVEAERSHHLGSSRTSRSKVLNFQFVFTRQNYDKLGYELFLRSFRRHFFGSIDVRITKARCEAFFDDPANFA